MDINEEYVKRNALLELENERLLAENAFLHARVAKSKSAFAIVTASELNYWSNEKMADQGLSSRTTTALENIDITMVADLIFYCRMKGGRETFKNLRNLGELSYNELIAWMDKRGFNY